MDEDSNDKCLGFCVLGRVLTESFYDVVKSNIIDCTLYAVFSLSLLLTCYSQLSRVKYATIQTSPGKCILGAHYDHIHAALVNF